MRVLKLNFKYFVAFLLIVSNLQYGFSQKVFDFEDQGLDWSFKNSSYWKVNTEQSVSGSYALKYTVPENLTYEVPAITSIDTELTIQKVRTAIIGDKTQIIANSYEGTVLSVGFDGAILWKNKLSGFMNHDIWCADLTGDGKDEVLAANADGNLYCIDANGKLLWTFETNHQNKPPMYAVCVVHDNGTPYVVCGGLDLSIYYISATGDLVKEIKSSTYSVEKPWGDNQPPSFVHYANFLRPVKKADGTEMLVVLGSNNHMQDRGSLYFFDVLENTPFKITGIEAPTVIGEFKVSDHDNDGVQEILLGTSGHHNTMSTIRFNIIDDSLEAYDLTKLGFGYSVTQPEFINDEGVEKYMFLVGQFMFLVDTDLDPESQEKLETKYSYNDMWKDPVSGKIILASSESGGSNIHIIDTQITGWKGAYEELKPKGKLEEIINNTEKTRNQLANYQKPESERDPLPVYLMTPDIDSGLSKTTADHIIANYNSPLFLGGSHMSVAEDWDRSAMENEKYKNKRDGRRNYSLTQQGAIDHITPWYTGKPGIAYWGGHGNDPYMFQRSTTEQIIDFANGKKTVLIYPELEDHSDDFAWVLNDLFYPLANYASDKNANIFVRTKHNFWQGNAYLPMWSRLLSGEFSNVFVPSMEETTDKAMDISIAGRAGIWASGATDSWGTRAVPDNPSFDRSRQFSNQRLPNHFLRHLIYHMANGAQYINNLAVDSDYISILWELVAKGALYIPKTNEIVSYSPVHLSMFEPDEHYLFEGSSAKWSTYYNSDFEDNNPFVFSRQNATWMASPVTSWDFSSYAGGVKDRRQNYLPNYPHGLVLITPPQSGAYADATAPRGSLTSHLHPLYQNIMKEYYTDGRYYYSADKTQQMNADTYASVIKNDLKESEQLIPLTVTGEVAWVVAQTSPTNLRLTVIDGGYLNPSEKKAIVKFQSVQPTNMKDILDGKTFDINSPSEVEVTVPCGGFRFIDITLSSPLN